MLPHWQGKEYTEVCVFSRACLGKRAYGHLSQPHLHQPASQRAPLVHHQGGGWPRRNLPHPGTCEEVRFFLPLAQKVSSRTGRPQWMCRQWAVKPSLMERVPSMRPLHLFFIPGSTVSPRFWCSVPPVLRCHFDCNLFSSWVEQHVSEHLCLSVNAYWLATHLLHKSVFGGQALRWQTRNKIPNSRGPGGQKSSKGPRSAMAANPKI